ncbi:PfkB family carbohydrate kinase [Kitasatospora sp. NPDC005751]|uniref:PfkB family carbohydrate kinase n=1 Tax=Kitasatospora sp. NPDC005751 TaxID=3157064 RepID=UPI0033F7D040
MNRETPGRVVAVGSVNADRILRCPVLPAPGETVLVTSVDEGFGGKGANQAVAAAALGAATHLVARVGADDAGRRALAELRRRVVGTGTVGTEGAAATGQALVMVDPGGENSILVLPGANALLSAGHVTDALAALRLRAGDVVLTSGEVPPPCLEAAAAAVAAVPGARWVHNAAPAGTLPAGAAGPGTLLVANAVEARQLTGDDDPAGAARALAALGGAAVVTLGGDGALVAEDGRGERVTAPPVAVVDSTGAGDVFCGALAAELARGLPLARAAATAVAAGAFAVTALGARGAVPGRADLERLLGG